MTNTKGNKPVSHALRGTKASGYFSKNREAWLGG